MQWLRNRQDDVYGMYGWEPATDRPYPDAAVSFRKLYFWPYPTQEAGSDPKYLFLIPHLMDQLGSWPRIVGRTGSGV